MSEASSSEESIKGPVSVSGAMVRKTSTILQPWERYELTCNMATGLTEGEEGNTAWFWNISNIVKWENKQRKRGFKQVKILPLQKQKGQLQDLLLRGKAHIELFKREASEEIKNYVISKDDSCIVFI